MCCGFRVTADGMTVRLSGRLDPEDEPPEVALLGGDGNHRPDPDTWIKNLKQSASIYYQAVKHNPNMRVALVELGTPCNYHILAETSPHGELGIVDPTRACGWVRRHINLAAMKSGGLSEGEIRRGATKPLTDYRKPHTRKRQEFEATRRKWPSE